EKRSRPSSAARPRSARLRPLGALEPAAPKSLEDARSPLGKSREMDGRPHRVESQAARPPGPARPPCHKGMTFLVDRELDSNPPMDFPPMARPILSRRGSSLPVLLALSLALLLPVELPAQS